MCRLSMACGLCMLYLSLPTELPKAAALHSLRRVRSHRLDQTCPLRVCDPCKSLPYSHCFAVTSCAYSSGRGRADVTTCLLRDRACVVSFVPLTWLSTSADSDPKARTSLRS